MELPSAVIRVAEACRAAGGRAWVVGGSVRDQLLGRPVKDHDLEVHGLEADVLLQVLRGLGKVDEVGRSFGVLKLTTDGQTLDISLPRRDSNVGPGHRGIRVQGDPHMGLVEAARRRDLTVNAILLDPLTGEVVDPFDGRADLAAGRLRAVDRETFLEDPLRALRAVQFAGRFELEADEELVALCRAAPLAELPAERVMGELEKLLLRSRHPSLGMALARRTAVLQRVLPPVAAVPAEQLDPALDRAALLRAEAGPRPRPLALMMAVLLHRLDLAQAEACMDRLKLHRRGGYPLRQRVLGAVEAWALLVEPVGDPVLKRLAEHHHLSLVALVALAATGRPAPRDALERARALGIDVQPLPWLVQGRDLHEVGVPPGPGMGELLRQIRDAQIAGRVSTREQALALASSLWKHDSDPGSP